MQSPDDASCRAPPRIAFNVSDSDQSIIVPETVGDIDVCVVLLDENLDVIAASLSVFLATAIGINYIHSNEEDALHSGLFCCW